MIFVKKTRTFVWLTLAVLQKYKKIIFLSALLGLLFFIILPKVIYYLPKPRADEKVGTVGKYTVNDLPQDILLLISPGLTQIAKDGSSLPALAKEWKISDDGRIYTFILRDNIHWQDGEEITADQIDYQFTDVKKEVIDKKTIKFELKEPFAPFLISVSSPILKEGLIGFGEYKIKRLIKKQDLVKRIDLEAKRKNVSFFFYPTLEIAINAFKLGEINTLKDLLYNPFEPSWLPFLEIRTEINKNEYIALFYNNSDQVLSDKNFRQALSYSIKDRPNDDNRVLTPISPYSWAYNDQVKSYDFDPEHAQSLLKSSQIEKKEEIELRLATIQPYLDLAEKIKQTWEKTLGIKVIVESVNDLKSDYQIFLGRQIIPPDPDQYILWHSTRSENITNFKSLKVDKALEDARKTLDQTLRKEKYIDFQKFLLEEAPVAFISHTQTLSIKRKTLFSSKASE